MNITTNHVCKAKRLDNDQWVYGYYVAVPLEYGHGEIAHLIIEQNCEYRECGEFSFDKVHGIDPSTLCHHIGTTDINGNPIFENDYVLTYHGRKCQVVWFSSPVHNGWDLVPIGGFEYRPPDKSSLWLYVKVIGNKFDSTELMEG